MVKIVHLLFMRDLVNEVGTALQRYSGKIYIPNLRRNDFTPEVVIE